MSQQLDPFNKINKLSYDANTNRSGSQTLRAKAKTFSFPGLSNTINRNLLFNSEDAKWYTRFNRYGWINPFDTDQVVKEFLFFTKPDLYIFEGNTMDSLNPQLSSQSPFFNEAHARHKKALSQLQYTVKDEDSQYNPFMCLLSNAVTSKMDLPTISSDTQDSTANIYGTTIQYRTHTLKSDNAFDFSLSFTDTAYLEIYTMVKAYDEFVRMMKLGEVSIKKKYIENHVDPTQFSVYKFLVGSDGETILYYAKATGVYFTDVPRGEFGDPGNDGFKYSLSFHSNFIEDNNPLIITEFNLITKGKESSSFLPVYDGNGANNKWGKWPYITMVGRDDKRVQRRKVGYDYRLKWTK